MKKINTLLNEMISYYSGDPNRIQHFVKVYSFAKMIGEMECLDEELLDTLEAAAVVHDIGIKAAEEKYGSSAGKLQEQEGPALAAEMLHKLEFDEKTVSRVAYLVGHHHTYSDIQGMDYQILVEADFLVNLYEHGSSKEDVAEACERIFCTPSGRAVCRTMFGLD
ncbi:HD domain-containing protein [Clostridium sp. AM58-1XD]|uniref:HD domain-containing protein n=1 Tax=Clostridium sp. AM58-1XD TaxID=2292307 RepID=UPI000E48A03E|nr:HD domain-containing protein [Clostridium sp. AM58-1XD]RGZ01803.1 HD domain-containing protein [Clostridium sp. AM58-1XD]